MEPWRARQRNKSYQSHLAAYLCQEVFTDMSVLPLVFPDNMSCFSRGSYKEELARKRQLPVPPMPRRGPRAIARSEDNVSGLSSRGGSISPSVSPSSPSRLTRYSSDTRINAPGQERASHVQPDIVTSSSTPSSEQGDPDKLEEEEEEGEGRGAVLPPSWAPECSFGGQVVAERESGRLAGGVGPLRRASTSPSWAPENEQLVEEEEQEEEEGGAKPPSDQDICDSASEVTSGENFEEDEVEEVERISARMNTFRKEERKPSLFTRAIERLSFRSSRRKKDQKRLAVEVEFVPTPVATKTNNNDTNSRQSSNGTRKQLNEVERQTERKVLPRVDSASTDNEVFLTPEEELAPPIGKDLVSGSGGDGGKQGGELPEKKVPPPVSTTFYQSRPLSDLDSALREFRTTTAASRENISNSRTDLSIASVRASLASRPPLALPRGAPPPAASTAWRQKAPPSNPYLENQWAKLSASMVDLSRSRGSLCPATGETSLSNETKPDEEAGDVDRYSGDHRRQTLPALSTRAVSMDTLDHSANQVPENKLGALLPSGNPYQDRIRASMERLSVPAWYRGSPSTGSPSLRSSSLASTTTPSSTSTPSKQPPTSSTTPKWRLSSTSSTSSTSTPSGWRRHLANATPSAPSTLSRTTTPYSSARYRTLSSTGRCPSSSSLVSATSSHSPLPPTQTPKQPYLGWRSQERLDIGPSYLNSPARRLAATTALPSQRSATLPNKTAAPPSPSTTAGIREVTTAIISYCSPPEKPRQAWGEELPKRGEEDKEEEEKWRRGSRRTEEEGEESDHSGDSGIDRSDDFCQEPLATAH